jgi:hypothetical protein
VPVADFILPEDEDLLDKMLTVLEFDNEDERNDYIRRQTRGKVKRVLREGKVISIKPLVSHPEKEISTGKKR